MADERGTCATGVDLPDLAAWTTSPVFLPPELPASPLLDLRAHDLAMRLANSQTGASVDVPDPCTPSFHGGAGEGPWLGTCDTSDGAGRLVPLSPLAFAPACEPVRIEGGSCATASLVSSLPALLLAVAAVAVRWRRGLLLAALLAVGARAEADDVLLPPSIEPGAWRFLGPTPTYVPWTVHGRLDGGYRFKPVTAVLHGDQRGALLLGLGTVSVGAGLDLFRWGRLSLALPVHFVYPGTAAAWVDPSLVPDGVVPGDLAVQIAAIPFRTRDQRTALRASVRVDAALRPRAPWTDGTSVAFDVGARHRLGPVQLGAQLGVLTARDDAPTALTWAAGASAAHRWFEGSLEFVGHLGFVGRSEVEGALVGPWSPAEASLLLGARLGGGLWLRVHGEAGLTRGIGAPVWGAGATLDLLGHPPEDLDHDGIVNLRDRCVRQPEDRDGYRDEDGCPDPDNDGDGFLDGHDMCRDAAETLNGFEDDDGCPDRHTLLSLTVAPESPDLVDTVSVQIDGAEYARLLEDLALLREVGPGPHELVVRATGHDPFVSTLDVPVAEEGDPDITIEVVAELARIRFTGLDLRLVDPDGAPVAGWAMLPGVGQVPVPPSGWSGSVRSGELRVDAGAPGFFVRAVAIEAPPDAVTEAVVELEPSAAWIDGRRLQLRHQLRFPLDEATPIDEDLPMLDALADLLAARPDLQLVRVEGHADSPGTSRYNYELSLARAEAVVRGLVARGVAASRLVAVGSGEAVPDASAATRTVDFLVLVWDDPTATP